MSEAPATPGTLTAVEGPGREGLSRDVAVAGAAFVLAAAWTFAVAASNSSVPPSFMLLLCWPTFALTAGILLDRGTAPRRRLARVYLALAALGPLEATWIRIRTARALSSDLVQVLAPVTALVSVGVAFALSWGLQGPGARAHLAPWLPVGLVGGLVAGLTEQRGPGWALVALAWAGHVLASVRDPGADARQDRRRHAWGLAFISACWAGVVVAQTWRPGAVADSISGLSISALALVLTRLAFVEEFRPLRDLLLDAGVVSGVLASALVIGALVRVGVDRTPLGSPDTFAAFAGLVTLALVLPVALGVRRSLLAHRYGSGRLSPADVAVITADLHSRAEPRDLLDKAARMVAASSGSEEVRILLGSVTEPVDDSWSEHPLMVGGDRVGTLAVRAATPGGLEPPQRRVVEQLLPTVALVVRAVSLAVEAEHARSDVARLRDAERHRILADLHDGIGPVLAGMSMRVQAALRRPGEPQERLLRDLATDLATCRTDLRGIVAGITPSVLDGGNLGRALADLVRSFHDGGHEPGRPAVTLHLDLAGDLPLPVQVTLYRCVAEGITNALRHAHATRIDVRVRSDEDGSVAEVVDDGRGGPVVPGVGLSSLRQRADGAGGRFSVTSSPAGGTRLRVELPIPEAAAS